MTKTLSWSGLRTVVGLELRQRVRSRGWVIALVCWFVVIGAITALIMEFVRQMYTYASPAADPGAGPVQTGGPLAFGVITLFVLGMGLVIAPAFTAASINGDRAAGTLATLQVTSLSAVEIAVGKLFAAWLTAAVFLVVALPFIIWSMVLGGISAWQVIVCFAVVLAEVLIMCAIGLGWSAVTVRTVGSMVLTYLSVLTLSLLTLIVIGLLQPLVTDWEGTTKSWDAQWDSKSEELTPEQMAQTCRWTTSVSPVTHSERVWWLLAANPFIVVADAAPLPESARGDLEEYVTSASDPLATIRLAMRALERGPETVVDSCVNLFGGWDQYKTVVDADGTTRVYKGAQVIYVSPVKRLPLSAGPPIWPWGLGVHLVLGVLGFVVAVRRLSVPYGKLPRDTRVA